MIFSPDLIRAVLESKKTMTRRPVKEPTTQVKRHGGRAWVPRPFEPHEGRTYAVQSGRGKTAIARIVVTAVRRELLGAITTDDASAEGFPSIAAFADYWMRLHDRGWPPTRKVPCPGCTDDTTATCAVCDGAGTIRQETPASDVEILDRFNARHADRLVWVITFELDQASTPRFLAERSEEGYTSDPLRALTDEPEAIDEQTADAYARTALERHERFLAREEAGLSLEQRLHRLRSEAARRGINLTRHEHAIRGRIEAAERALGKKAA